MSGSITSPAFVRLGLARALSAVGDGLTLVALMIYITETNAGGVALGLLLFAEIMPSFLSPLLGALSDRVERRRLMMACELGQGVIMATLALWNTSFYVLLVMVFLRSLLFTAIRPALMSAIPAVIDEPHLDRANALLRTGEEGAGVLGPGVAAFLASFVGVRGLFAIDAVTFLLAVPLLWGLPKLPAPASTGPREGVFKAAVNGLEVLRSHAVAGRIAAGLFLFVLFAAMENVARPFLATGPLSAGDRGIGLLHAAPQLGIILGFLLIARIGLGRRALLVVLGGMLLCSLGSLLTAPAVVLSVALIAQFVSGIGNGLAVASIDTLLQRSVPKESLGRVFANVYGGANIAAGLAYLIGGPLLAVVEARGLFVVTGVGGLGAALLTGLSLRPSLRAAEAERAADGAGVAEAKK